MSEPIVQRRRLGKTGVEIPVLSMGGHAFIWEPTPSPQLGGEILGYLLDHGVTHFDVTFARERQAYRRATDSAGLTNYHIVDGKVELQDFETFVPETHGSNMFKRDMVRWRSVRG